MKKKGKLTVEELVNLLSKQPKDYIVVLRDMNGNELYNVKLNIRPKKVKPLGCLYG